MLDKFFDTLAIMGIWIRLNDGRTEPPSEHKINRIFPPRKYLSTEIPLGALYDPHAPGEYYMRASCPVLGEAGDAILSSNKSILGGIG